MKGVTSSHRSILAGTPLKAPIPIPPAAVHTDAQEQVVEPEDPGGDPNHQAAGIHGAREQTVLKGSGVTAVEKACSHGLHRLEPRTGWPMRLSELQAVITTCARAWKRSCANAGRCTQHSLQRPTATSWFDWSVCYRRSNWQRLIKRR